MAKMSRGSHGMVQIRVSVPPSASRRTWGDPVTVPRAIPSDQAGEMPRKVPSRSGISGLGGESAMPPKSNLGITDPMNSPSVSK